MLAWEAVVAFADDTDELDARVLTHLPCLKPLGVDGPALDVFVPGFKADTVEDALLLVDTGPVAAAADRARGREEGEGTSGLAWPPRDNALDVFGMVPNIDRRLPSAIAMLARQPQTRSFFRDLQI